MSALAKAPAGDWGVFVDEVKLNAIGGSGIEWWSLFWQRFEAAGRITGLTLSIAGGHWHVACDSEEDAASLLGLMTANGVHPKCVKVAGLASCVRTAEAKRARSAEAAARLAAFMEAGRGSRDAWTWWVNNVMPDAIEDPKGAGRALRGIGYPGHDFMQPVKRLYEEAGHHG